MADTYPGGYANWVRREATDEQIIAMRALRDKLRDDLRDQTEWLKNENGRLRVEIEQLRRERDRLRGRLDF